MRGGDDIFDNGPATHKPNF
jgi:WD40 repeat protein